MWQECVNLSISERQAEMDGWINVRRMTAAVNFRWWSVIKYFSHAQIINAQNHKQVHTETHTHVRMHTKIHWWAQTEENKIQTQALFYLCWCDASGHAPREEHCFSHLTHPHTSTHKTHKPSEVTSVHFTSPSVRSHAETLVQAASLEVNQGNQMCVACVRLTIWCVYNLGTHSVLAQTRGV